jgi:PII-like signaling protein
MHGIYLKIFVPEALRNHGDLFYEWILREAEAIGIPGGSATRALAGFGRNGHLQEQHFFELAGELPILLEFFAPEADIDRLLDRLKTDSNSLFYIKLHAEAGYTSLSD